MEQRLDKLTAVQEQLREALEKWQEALPDYERIVEYYTGEEWRADFEDSEKGLIPPEISQGVLTEDLVYNMMIEQRQLAIYTAKAALDILEKA